MVPVVIAFGSNLGDREANIQEAIRSIVDCGLGIGKLESKAESDPIHNRGYPTPGPSPISRTSKQGRGAILRVSSFYETAPMYVEDQPTFLNGAILAETDFSPREFLSMLKATEAQIGRHQGPRNGPREIDLDLIAYGSLLYRWTPIHGLPLVIPHPRTEERRFVLEPLNEIAPGWVLPGKGPIAELLQSPAVQSQAIRRLDHAPISISRV